MEFRPLQLCDETRHRKLVDYTVAMESEFIFSTLYLWRDSWNIKICDDPAGLFYSYEYKNKLYFLQPLPEQQQDFNLCMQKLIDYADNKGIPFIMPLISAHSINRLDNKLKDRLVLKEDRNNFDYLYSAEALQDLSGKKYHAKRNYVSRFKNQYDYVYSPLYPEDAPECMSLYRLWLDDSAYEGAHLEALALKNAFEHFNALHLVGGAIRINGQLCAFTIGDRVTDRLAVIQFEKADTRYDGIYAAINQLFAQQALGGIQWINREEDMGIEGLRKSKLSYHPAKLLGKWTASLHD